MKIITLAVPATVDTGNPPRGFAELRQPIEGPLTVSDDEAQRLQDANLLASEPEDVELPVGDEPDVERLDDMTVAELHVVVVKEGVALNDATKKADILAAIKKHRDAHAA